MLNNDVAAIEVKPEITGKNLDDRDEHGRFIKGVSGNPLGKPKGRFSIKSRIVKRLEENPDELESVIEYLIKNERALLFQMIDGRPHQSGELEVRVPKPIIDTNVSKNDGVQQNTQPD